MEMMKTELGKREEAGVRSDADMTAQQAEQVKQSMSDAQITEKPAPKRKGAKEAVTVSPRKKARKEASSLLSQHTKKLKTKIDKTQIEINVFEKAIPQLSEKGYPAEMQDWCRDKLSTIRTEVMKAQDIYNREVVKTIAPETPTKQLQTDTEHIEATQLNLDTFYKEWDKTAGAEIRKFIG